MLAIEVMLLTGRYVATAHNTRSESEWPPHPARLFSALVATHFAADDATPNLSDERTLLEWLEGQGPPSILASEATPREVVTVFVPVNDAALTDVDEEAGQLDDARAALSKAEASGDAKAVRKYAVNVKKAEAALQRAIVRKTEVPSRPLHPRYGQRVLPEYRVRQSRTFPSMTPCDPRVTYVWTDAALTDEQRGLLDGLLGRVVRLGHSSSLVSVRLVGDPGPPTWRPAPDGEATFRVVETRQLAALERAFESHREVEPRVMPAVPQPYTREATETSRLTPKSLFSDDWLVLRRVEGPFLPMTATAGVARAVRKTLMSFADEPIPEVLSGHIPDGRPSLQPHLAIVPLPFVGHQHASGAILGVALVLPRTASASDRRAVYKAIAAWEQKYRQEDEDTPIVQLNLGAAGELRLERVEWRSVQASLRSSVWCGRASGWCSVTPVALDRNPGDLRSRDPRKLAGAMDEAVEIVCRACVRIELPTTEVRGDPARVAVGGIRESGTLPPVSGRRRSHPAGADTRPHRVRPACHRTDSHRRRAIRGPWPLQAGGFSMSELPLLDPGDFAAFFRAVHDRDPFPWQQRLARQVAETGWPGVLDLPTGTGKTAALDVAVFALALDAGRKPRSAPLRIIYVVDRRTIVDQAYERARKIRRALVRADDDVVRRVRERLARYPHAGVPLRTALLRGGIARDDMWARTPDQPLIAVSTVDQVGSRLLFRGYGVTDSMKPVHAGLLGCDVLYLLDEVHLSQPFRETLTAIGDRYRTWAERRLPGSFVVVEMSATPGGTSESAFRLEDADRRHAVLSARLQASKPVSLVSTTAKGFPKEIAKHVLSMLDRRGATIAVVVNRVKSARDLHQFLCEAVPEGTSVRLLTGRMRPFDRDALERSLLERVRAGRCRSADDQPTVIVATQSIEAGADFDFDALVTECASLDALRQRFGRLDRLGELAGSARGVIVARTDSLKDDPVYGDAIGKTWDWLCGSAGGQVVDFGIDALVVPQDAEERGLLVRKQHAPVLLPSHLDAWVQTAPIPEPDPDVDAVAARPEAWCRRRPDRVEGGSNRRPLGTGR